MASTLFPEMAHGAIRPILDWLGKDRRDEDFAAPAVREFLYACGAGAAVLDRLMEMLQKLLGEGLEGRRASSLQTEFAEVIELALTEVYPKARAILPGSALSDAERQAGLELLDGFTARASSMRDKLAELQQLLERPVPRVDLTKVIGNKPAGDYEGYLDTADLWRDG